MTSPLITNPIMIIHREPYKGHLFYQRVGENEYSVFLYRKDYWRVFMPCAPGLYKDTEMVRFTPRERDKEDLPHVTDEYWKWIHDCCLYILMLEDPFQRNERIIDC